MQVREYVKECGLEEILVPIYGIYATPDEIEFEKLPSECYIKCNHTSGYNYLYRRSLTDEKWLKKLLVLYLRQNHYQLSMEWVYKKVFPKIIIEKKLENKDGTPLLDYRMFCFDGEVKVVMVNIGTATESGEHAKKVVRSFYSPKFEPISELRILGDNANDVVLLKPVGWNRMVEVAQQLSAPFSFCRVDLYNIDGKIYLSELTFFPNSGINDIQPKEWAMKMGEWIDLEKCRYNSVYEYKN